MNDAMKIDTETKRHIEVLQQHGHPLEKITRWLGDLERDGHTPETISRMVWLHSLEARGLVTRHTLRDGSANLFSRYAPGEHEEVDRFFGHGAECACCQR
jgi:hypothetical protein